MRYPGSTLRSSLQMLACIMLLVRALVPVGYMIGSDAANGELAVLLCPVHSELPADNPTRSAHAGSHFEYTTDHGDRLHDAQIESCAFSLAFVPLVPPPQSIGNLLVDIRDALFFESRQSVPSGNAPVVTTARGPPQHS